MNMLVVAMSFLLIIPACGMDDTHIMINKAVKAQPARRFRPGLIKLKVACTDNSLAVTAGRNANISLLLSCCMEILYKLTSNYHFVTHSVGAVLRIHTKILHYVVADYIILNGSAPSSRP